MSYEERPDEPEVSARADADLDPAEHAAHNDGSTPAIPGAATPQATGATNAPTPRRRRRTAATTADPAPPAAPEPSPAAAAVEPDVPAFLRDRAARQATEQTAVAATPGSIRPPAAPPEVRIIGGAPTPTAAAGDTRAAGNTPGDGAPPSPAAPAEQPAPTTQARRGHHKIYVMGDRRTKEARYVGRTRNVARRVTQHLNAALNGDHNPRSGWLRELIAAQERPVVQVVAEYGTEEEAIEAEARWIRTLRAEGHRLTNAPLPDEPTAERVLDERVPTSSHPTLCSSNVRSDRYLVGLGGLAALVLAVILWSQSGARRAIITPPARLTQMLPPATPEPDLPTSANAPSLPYPTAAPLENPNVGMELVEHPVAGVPEQSIVLSSPAPALSAGEQQILVQVGDTFESIAQRAGISADALAAALGGRRRVYAGETISLPLAEPPTPLPITTTTDATAAAPTLAAVLPAQPRGGWSGGGDSSGGGGGGGSAGAFGDNVREQATDSPTHIAGMQATAVSPGAPAWSGDGATAGGGGGSSGAFGDDPAIGAGEMPMHIAGAQATAVPPTPTPAHQPASPSTQRPLPPTVGGWAGGGDDAGGGGGGGGSSGVIP